MVYVKDSFDDNKFYSGSFKVNKYKDQKIHNLWINLGGGNLEGKDIPWLHLQIHYIYSKSKITENTV